MPIMGDLICFKNILSALQDDLNKYQLSSQDNKKNSSYYKSTLEKLVNKLFIKEEDDGQEGDEIDVKHTNHHSLMSHKNQLLEKVKKELLQRGQYQEVD